MIAGGGVLGSVIWISHLIHLIRHRAQAVFLADLVDLPSSDGIDPAAASKVAVIFAARDEATKVEATVRSLLPDQPRDASLRVIAVDDRSTDGTGAILDRLATTYPQLAVVHVTELPAGWLGKTHALQSGSDSLIGLDARWLLFTDADVVFQPGMIRRAVTHAEATGVDLVTVAPEVDTRSVGERTFLTLFGLLFSLYGPIGRLSDRRSKAHIGIGAFSLIRAEVFRAVGGFHHLALSVDDDMRLGQTIKFAGYSTRYLMGAGAVSVRWQEGTRGMIQGVEKNFFAGLKFSIARVVVVGLGLIVLGIGPFSGLLIGPMWTRVVAGCGIAAVATMLAGAHRQSRVGWYYVWTLPAAAILILIALVRSVSLTLRQGGVIWRNHHYPLGVLKAHVKDRDAWLDQVWRSTR